VASPRPHAASGHPVARAARLRQQPAAALAAPPAAMAPGLRLALQRLPAAHRVALRRRAVRQVSQVRQVRLARAAPRQAAHRPAGRRHRPQRPGGHRRHARARSGPARAPAQALRRAAARLPRSGRRGKPALTYGASSPAQLHSAPTKGARQRGATRRAQRAPNTSRACTPRPWATLAKRSPRTRRAAGKRAAMRSASGVKPVEPPVK